MALSFPIIWQREVSDFSPVVISNPTLTQKVVGYESSVGVGGGCLSCMGRLQYFPDPDRLDC